MRWPGTRRDKAIEELAKALVKELEGLDPTDDWDFTLDAEANWARVNEQQKTVYRLCVEAVLSNDDWVKIALGS